MWEIKGKNPGGQLIRVCLDQNQSLNCSLLISGSCQTVLGTLNPWFTEGLSSERNRGSFFHITLILSVAGLCQCWSHPVSPEVDSCLDRDHRGHTVRCLRCQGNSWRHRSRCLAHTACTVGFLGHREPALTPGEVTTRLSPADPFLTQISGKGRTLIQVKSFESLFTRIYKTMCSEQNSPVGCRVSNAAGLQPWWPRH